MGYYVYILASAIRGTLYIGVTNDLARRVYEHRTGLVEGFTKRHGVKSLVHFETLADPASAIEREKKLKKWRRARKIELIERDNPDWADLYQSIT
ncbi:MAG: GIY-YIG nuclease family protein [Alphaproteobacteria bacterium]